MPNRDDREGPARGDYEALQHHIESRKRHLSSSNGDVEAARRCDEALDQIGSLLYDHDRGLDLGSEQALDRGAEILFAALEIEGGGRPEPVQAAP